MNTLKGSVVLLLALALLPVACSASPDVAKEHPELAQNRQKWADQRVGHYRFNLSIGCFCPFVEQMPLTIEVLGGKIFSIETADGNPIHDYARETYEKAATMENLFALVEAAYAGDAEEVTVEYDPVYGFPSMILIDRFKEAIDDGISYKIENFQAFQLR